MGAVLEGELLEAPVVARGGAAWSVVDRASVAAVDLELVPCELNRGPGVLGSGSLQLTFRDDGIVTQPYLADGGVVAANEDAVETSSEDLHGANIPKGWSATPDALSGT